MSAMKDFLSNCRVQLIFCKDNVFMRYMQKDWLNFDKKKPPTLTSRRLDKTKNVRKLRELRS